MKKFLLICLVVTGMTGMLSAQNTFDNVPSEHIYHEAKTMFDAKNWVGCIDKLSRFKSEVINKGVANSILNSQLQSKKSTAVINMFEEVDYMLAVANFETGSENALDDLIAYRNDYPDSYNSPVISFLIGTFYFIEEDYPDALTAFEDLEIDQLPVNYQPDYLHRLGVTYLKSNEIEKAEPCFLALSSMNTKYTRQTSL